MQHAGPGTGKFLISTATDEEGSSVKIGGIDQIGDDATPIVVDGAQVVWNIFEDPNKPGLYTMSLGNKNARYDDRLNVIADTQPGEIWRIRGTGTRNLFSIEVQGNIMPALCWAVSGPEPGSPVVIEPSVAKCEGHRQAPAM
ncbi:hypothetical protein HYDPIDRAFT_169351 [Hydnomerulius pinastri MD-312]|uniref:Uncharacterized protein n=1 Tax=Hydnomerulius pinastri MD-312 TaxID=994086 RepID=A0A0C9WCB1_9AGAM|nr:hypothetical protein HYDPIDRAFT_169351 [Hydnomerulius pinastri MD-312]